MRRNSQDSNYNPLQRMFGSFLRLERKRTFLSVEEVANGLGLAATYYRLLESGSATFNQGSLLRLIKIFESGSASAGIAPSQIHFHRVAMYLVGAQCVNSEMSKMIEKGETGKIDLLAVEILAEHDSDFNSFHKNTLGYYSCKEDEKRKFLEEVAVPILKKFFGTVNQLAPPVKIISFLFDGSIISYLGEEKQKA